MKQKFSIPLTALFAATAVAGSVLFANAVAQTKSDLAILWMTAGPSDQAIFEKYGKLYEQANPGVSVQTTFVTLPQLSQKLQLMIAGNTPPDVARVVTANIAQFGSLATDLTGIIDPKDFLATQVPYIKAGKKIIGAPLDATVTALYYNKDCFNEAGIKAPSNVQVPWTWAQWRTAMETVTKKSKCRFALSWDATTHRFSSTLYQAGGRYIDAAGKNFAVDSSEGLRAFTFFHDLFKDGLAQKSVWLSGEDSTGLFKSGLTAMYMATNGHLGLLAPIKNFAWGVMPMPRDKVRSTNPGGTFALGFKDGKNAAEGAKFIKWITSKEVNSAYSKELLAMSGRKDSQDIKYGSYDDEYNVFRSDLTASPSLTGKDWANPAMAKMNVFIRENIVKMILDQQTPKQTLEAITIEGNKYLK
jgi:alpha-1,4-digalacturonate transport system substrate-binding protein